MSKIIAATFMCAVLLFGEGLSAPQEKSAANRVQTYTSQTAGFRVNYRGTVTSSGKSGVSITLPAAPSANSSNAFVRISSSNKPFVYLPGTYGGDYYFEESNGGEISSDRVPGDSVTVNGLNFAKDYWAVYAGMGQWETVINCYALYNGQYYVVSLRQDFRTNLPGSIINGTRVTQSQMRDSLVNKMRDTTNAYVKTFNQILNSFSITR